jgi:uncharacterized membrane protein YqjE
MDERTVDPAEHATEEPEHPGMLRGLLATALATLRTRLDLAAVEIEIYALRLVQMLVWAVAAIACILLDIAFGLVAIIIALWDTHRIAGLLGGTVAFAVLALVCGLIGARTFRNRPPLLEGTLQQLDHDHRSANGGSQ